VHQASGIPYLRELVIFLVAAGIVVPVFHRLKMSPVLGYLIIGGVIGPYGLGLFVDQMGWFSLAVISDIDGVRRLAELGVIFLLFTIGLELSLDRIWSMRRFVFGLGGLQVGVTGAGIAALIWALGGPAETSVALGACLALSSTAIVMQILIERRQLGTPLGRASFSILLMQDLAVVPILFIVSVFGAAGESGMWRDLAFAILKAVSVIGGIFVAGRLVLRPLFRMVSHSRSAEMFMAATLLVVIGAAAITGFSGASTAMGAFLAGLLLAETEYRHQIEVDIAPFKGLLLGLFFISVGMGIDYRLVGEHAQGLLAAVVGLFALKALIIYLLARLFGLPMHTALETGLLLGQAGEFAFVAVALARSLGLLPDALAQFVLIVVGLSMVATPFIALGARRLGALIERLVGETAHAVGLHALEGLEGHIVIAGFGRVGRTVGALCDAEELPYLALDRDSRNLAEARAADLPAYFGDASRIEMLRRAQLGTARALVVTMDDPAAAEQVVRKARGEYPDLPIYARARNAAHARNLLALGASEAVPENLESSLQLAGRVLASTGCSDEVIARRIDAQRMLELEHIKA
jgi:monovalent cation:proton antiporter-2 (CPA2) family protein